MKKKFLQVAARWKERAMTSRLDKCPRYSSKLKQTAWILRENVMPSYTIEEFSDAIRALTGRASS